MPPRTTRKSNFESPSKAGLAVFGLQEATQLTLGGANPHNQPVLDRPTTLEQSCQRARQCASGNGFIQSIIEIRYGFYNYGFKVVPEDEELEGKKLDDFEAWEKKHRDAIQKYQRDAWLEWLRVDSVIALWRSNGGKAFRVKPEDSDFKDKFAIERLTYTHGLTADEVRKIPGLTARQIEVLSRSHQIELTHDDESVFAFEVLKRAPVGEGLGFPTMQAVFLAASTYESLEVADAQLAKGMRRVLEVHEKGHETRYGVSSGGKQNFLKDEYAKAFLKKLKGVKGYLELCLNWDHKITWPRPDPKHFDVKRYGSAMEALVQWSMPIGHMLVATTINPYLYEILRILAGKERDYLRPHLRNVITKTLKPPVAITLQWEDSCFFDPRLRFDMLKTGLSGGPLSQTTYLKRIGEDPKVERKLKTKEAKLPEEQTMPIYDPAHGDPNAAGDGERAGRKRGSGDKKAGK